MARSVMPSTCWRFSARSSASRRRSALAERPLSTRHYDTDHFDRAESFPQDYCGMEYLSQHRPCRVLSLCRPDRMADGLLRYDHRRLPRNAVATSGSPVKCEAWQGGCNLLLGLVDFLGTVCRDVHRAHFARPDENGRRDVCAEDQDLWWHATKTIDMVNNWDLYKGAFYGNIARNSDISWLTWGMSALATLLLAAWFITSPFDITTMLSMGDDNPSQKFRIIWGMMVLLLAGGRRLCRRRPARRPCRSV